MREALRHSGTHGLMLGTLVPTLGVGLREEPTFSLGKEGAETAHPHSPPPRPDQRLLRGGLPAGGPVGSGHQQCPARVPQTRLGAVARAPGWPPSLRSWLMGPGPQCHGSYWREQTPGCLQHRPFQPEPAAAAPGSPGSSCASRLTVTQGLSSPQTCLFMSFHINTHAGRIGPGTQAARGLQPGSGALMSFPDAIKVSTS